MRLWTKSKRGGNRLARIRSVKPETFTSFTLATVPIQARFLFIGLWTEADDEGKLIDSAKLIAGSIFPHDDDVTAKQVNAWLDALASIEAIVRYEVDGAKYILVKEWGHQKISHPGASRIPNPSGNPPESLRNNSGDSPEFLRPDLGSRIIGSRNRDTWEKNSGEPGDFEDDFAEVWNVVPKRKSDGRGAVLKHYAARRNEGITADELMTAAKGYRDDPERNRKPEFTMGASKFFGAGEYWRNYLDSSGFIDENFGGLVDTVPMIRETKANYLSWCDECHEYHEPDEPHVSEPLEIVKLPGE